MESQVCGFFFFESEIIHLFENLCPEYEIFVVLHKGAKSCALMDLCYIVKFRKSWNSLKVCVPKF